MTSVVAKLYDTDDTQIAELPDFSDAQVQDKLNDENAWTMKYDQGGRNFNLLIQDEDLSIKFFVDGQEVFEGVIEEDNWDEVAEDNSVTLAGRSWAGQFEFAKVYPNGGVGVKNDGWTFTTASPGKIFTDLLASAKGRGTVPNLNVSFTATTDSNGQAWTNHLSITYKTGASLLDILKNFGSSGLADWRMEGKTLHMYNPRTVLGAQSGVTFRRGRDIKTAPRSRSRRSLGTVYLVAGDESVTVERVDDSAVAARGRKEQFISQGGVTDTGTLNVLGDLNLTVFSNNRLSKTHTLVFRDDATLLLVPNFNFEANLTGWNGAGATISREVTPGTPAFSGSWSMKITPDGVAQYPGANTDWFAVKPGITYDVGAFMMSETTRFDDLNINWFALDGTYLSTTNVASVGFTAGEWQEVVGTATAPAGADWGNLSPTVPNTPPVTDVLWVDEAVVTHTTRIPKPWRDYKPGMYIDTDLTGDTENYRLVAMTVTMGTDGYLNGEVTLNDIFEEREILLDGAVTVLTGGSSGNGAATTPAKVAERVYTPKAPIGLDAVSTAYVTGSGDQFAQVTASWAAVTENIEGNAFDDFDRYELQWWYDDEATLVRTITSGDNLAVFSGLLTGKPITLRVRAVNGKGRKGPYSDPFSLNTGEDVTPPPVPSAPVVEPFVGLIRVEWDGRGSAGEIMPLDFKYTEVWYSTINDFTPGDPDTFLADVLPAAGAANISGITYGTTYYVKLVSVDNMDNHSVPSVQGDGVPRQVVATDIGNNVIDFSNIRFKDVGNLIPDGSFEYDTTAELINGQGLQMQVVPNPSGATAPPSPDVLKVSSGTPATLVLAKDISVAPEQRFTLIYSFLQSGFDGGVNDRAYIQIIFYNSAGTATVNNQTFNSTTNNAAWSTRNAAVFEAPADAVRMSIAVYGAITTATAALYLDQLEVRLQAGTVLIEDAAINSAKIAELAVNNAHIANVSAGKLTVGTLTADITVSARIKTADTGARVEINSGGIGAWNASNLQTVSIAGANGSVSIIGQIKTGTAGRRLEFNPTNTGLPEIRFFATTGSNYGFLNAIGTGADVAIGLNSGSWIDPGGTELQSRLYMGKEFIQLQTIKSDGEDQFGGQVHINSTHCSVGLVRGGGNDNYINFENDGHMYFIGEVDYFNNSQNAIMMGNRSWNDGPFIAVGTNYGPTLSTTPAVIATLWDDTGSGDGIGTNVEALNTTSFYAKFTRANVGAAGSVLWWAFRL